MHMEGPQCWDWPSTEPLVIGAMQSLCIGLILTSGTFRVTGCLSSISYASWGHRSFQILVFLPLWGKLRGSLIPPLLRYGTAHFLLNATTGSEYLCIATAFQVRGRKWDISSHSPLKLGLRIGRWPKSDTQF